nr:MAG TPA: hypothetical protein [Caudoviricetes sp.]
MRKNRGSNGVLNHEYIFGRREPSFFLVLRR